MGSEEKFGNILQHLNLYLHAASTSFDMTADDFLQRLVVRFSGQQLLRSKEQDVFKYFTDFIQAL
jgi:flagellar motor protein MotB